MSEGILGSSATSGAATPLPIPPSVSTEKRLSPGQWGMICFLTSDVPVFATLIVAYLVFYGRDSEPGGMGGPTPLDSLSLPLAIGMTFCLLASSVTVHMADRAIRFGRPGFVGLWTATIALGIAFLLGTAHEWNGLINHLHLTISRNLFGSTFYTLVGFHALHVTVGVIIMLLVLVLALRGAMKEKSHVTVELVSWYWHFVDGVWIVVFSVVYLMPHLG